MKYRERYDEAKLALARAQDDEFDKAGGDNSKLPVNDWKRIDTVIDSYFADRSKLMETATGLLRNTSATGKDQDDLWKNHFDKAAEDAFKRIGDLVKDKKRSKLSPFSYYNRIHDISIQERVFLKCLAGLPLAKMQGTINEHGKTFEEEQKKLRDKWEDLKGRDRSFDDRLKKTVDDVRSTYEHLLKKVVNDHLALGRKLIDWLEGFKFVDEGTNPATPSWLEPIVSYLRNLEALTTSPAQLRDRLDSLIRSEGTLVVLFGKTREGVEKFLEAINLEKLEDQVEAAKKASLDKVSDFRVPGLAEDGKAFVEETAKELQTTLWSFTTKFNSFINEFRGVFLGPVEDRTVEDLLEVRESEDAGEEIRDLHIERKLRELYDQVRDWDLDLDGISPKHQQYIQDMIRREMDRLAPKIKSAEDLTFRDANRISLALFKEQLVDKMRRFKAFFT